MGSILFPCYKIVLLSHDIFNPDLMQIILHLCVKYTDVVIMLLYVTCNSCHATLSEDI